MALKIGELLNDHFEIKQQVGHGGFSVVYLAYDHRLRDRVALKVFNPEYAARFGDPQVMRKRFVQEAQVARKLRHDYIVPIYDLDSSEELSFIVMPYLPNTLEDRLEQLTIPEAVPIMLQICEGAAYAHSQRVVHCDIKPSNILFDDKEQVRITDFGIAHVPHEADTTDPQITSEFRVGTVLYMSPEQLTGKRDDPRIDVYALGALFCRMLTRGQYYLNFDLSGTVQARASNISRIFQEEPRRDRLANVPPPLTDVILKALSKKPEDRYADANKMLSALMSATSGARDTIKIPTEELPRIAASRTGYEPASSLHPSSETRRCLQEMFNPYISEAPVTNPTMFFGRREILDGVLSSVHSNHFAIYGPKRIGKTSLLHQIAYHLSQRRQAQFKRIGKTSLLHQIAYHLSQRRQAQLDYLPIFVSLQDVSEASFFRELMRRLVAGLREKKDRYRAERLPLQCQSRTVNMVYDGTDFVDDLAVLRDALHSPQSPRDLRLVLLVDEGDVLNTFGQATLARLRAIFMQYNDCLKMVLSRESKDVREWKLLGSPWESIFSSRAYHLTHFTPDEARSLIVNPVQHCYHYQPEAVELILKRSQQVPRYLQSICRQAVNEMLSDQHPNGEITLRHVQVALSKVPGLPTESSEGSERKAPGLPTESSEGSERKAPGLPTESSKGSERKARFLRPVAFAIILGAFVIVLVTMLILRSPLPVIWPGLASTTPTTMTVTKVSTLTPDVSTFTLTPTFTPVPTFVPTIMITSTATSTSTSTPKPITPFPGRTSTPLPTCPGDQVWNGTECRCPADKPDWLNGRCNPKVIGKSTARPQ